MTICDHQEKTGQPTPTGVVLGRTRAITKLFALFSHKPGRPVEVSIRTIDCAPVLFGIDSENAAHDRVVNAPTNQHGGGPHRGVVTPTLAGCSSTTTATRHSWLSFGFGCQRSGGAGYLRGCCQSGVFCCRQSLGCGGFKVFFSQLGSRVIVVSRFW